MFGCSRFSTTAPVQQTAFVICFQVLLLGSRESRDHRSKYFLEVDNGSAKKDRSLYFAKLYLAIV